MTHVTHVGGHVNEAFDGDSDKVSTPTRVDGVTRDVTMTSSLVELHEGAPLPPPPPPPPAVVAEVEERPRSGDPAAGTRRSGDPGSTRFDLIADLDDEKNIDDDQSVNDANTMLF